MGSEHLKCTYFIVKHISEHIHTNTFKNLDLYIELVLEKYLLKFNSRLGDFMNDVSQNCWCHRQARVFLSFYPIFSTRISNERRLFLIFFTTLFYLDFIYIYFLFGANFDVNQLIFSQQTHNVQVKKKCSYYISIRYRWDIASK